MIQLIESHAEKLATDLMNRLRASEKCRELVRNVPASELEMRNREIYRHLSDWLLLKTELEIEEQYVGLGLRRAQQGVPFSDFLYALACTKECLWEYLEREGLLEDPVELLGDLNLLHALGRFFDRIAYSSAVGFERFRQQAYNQPGVSVSARMKLHNTKTS
jgi:hypothetical protein